MDFLPISKLTEKTQPNITDFIPIVDPTNKTQAPSGTTEKISTFNFLQATKHYIPQGNSNDIAGFNNALLDLPSTGGELIIREGTLFSDGSFTIPYSNTIVRGMGAASVIRLVNNANKNVFSALNVSNISILDLLIDGNSSNQTGDSNSDIDGLVLDHVTNAFIERVYTNNTFNIGICARNSNGIIVLKAVVNNPGLHGIALGNSNASAPLAVTQKSSVAFCHVNNAGNPLTNLGMGIGIFYSHDCEVVDNTIDGSVEGNISVYSNDATAMAYSNTVARNTCLNAGNVGTATGAHGITSNDGAKQLHIIDNTVRNPREFGIYLDSQSAMATVGDDSTVHNNKVFNSGNRGLDIKVGLRLKVTENKTFDAGLDGIRVICSGVANQISNNTAYNSVNDGIQIMGATYSTILGNIGNSNGHYGITFVNNPSNVGCTFNTIDGNTTTLNTAGGMVEQGNANNNNYGINKNFNNTTNDFVTVGANNFIVNGNTLTFNGVNPAAITIAQSLGNGNALTIQAGKSAIGGLNTTGGALNLKASGGTGNNGAGVISFFTPTDTTSGITTQGVTEKMRLLTSGNGRLIIGGVFTQSVDGIIFMGSAARSLLNGRNTTVNTIGTQLTVQAGGASLQATNKNGADLVLSGGIPTGSGLSRTLLKAFAPTTGVLTTLQNIVINAKGSAYVVNDVVTITGGGANATATINTVAAAGQLGTVVINNAGAGYVNGDVLTVSGAGSGATITVNVVSLTGAILLATLTTGGSGYSNATGAATTGGTGAGATFDTTILATGAVTSATLTAIGTGYSLATNVSTTGGTGTGVTFDIVPFDNADNSQITVATFDGKGNMAVGTQAINTTATDGFLYIPTCAGAPTGIPTTNTGLVPMVYDSANNNFYFYNGAWKKVAIA